MTGMIVPGASIAWKIFRYLVERIPEMEKIVILSNNQETNKKLTTYLNMLFPECEIQVLSREMESPGNVPVALEHAITENGRGQKWQTPTTGG